MGKVKQRGSVRVDLVGGTLDLRPINLILENVVTLNFATSLAAEVELEIDVKQDHPIELFSHDYQKKYHWDWESLNNERGPLYFIGQILNVFKKQLKTRNISLSLRSDAPAGSGLGGSSAMGVTLFKALCRGLELDFDRVAAIQIVNDLEGKILNRGPAGYQDYYPALYGGILALHPCPGHIEVEQLYNPKLAKQLSERITLVSSGISRNSGLNNWEVYKSFFDDKNNVKDGMTEISRISQRAYQALKKGDIETLLSEIAAEGQAREKLFPGIVCPEVKSVFRNIKEIDDSVGMKVCGAGGGGCFLLVHKAGVQELVQQKVSSHGMQCLKLSIQRPLEE